MTTFTPCHASAMLGALMSEIEHQFSNKKARKVWLDKIQAKLIYSDDRSTVAWVLPDGAGVEMAANSSLEHMRAAARTLATHIAGEIWGLEHGQEAAQLEMANPPVGVHRGNFGLENDMPDFDSAHPAAVDDASLDI